jgi:hypothetical protein
LRSVGALGPIRVTCGNRSHRLLGCLQPGTDALCGGLRSGRATESNEGVRTVKKVLVLVLVALGGFLVWRRLQQDRAELDLWNEATSGEN